MKYLLFIPFAILLGLAAGSWAERSKLMQLRSEIRDLKKELKSNNRSGKFSAINSIIKIPEKKSGRKPGQAKSASVTQGDSKNDISALTENPGDISQVESTNSVAKKRRHRKSHIPDPKSENYETELKEAKELWQTRVEIAKSQWVSKLDLDAEGEALFDEAITAMNEEIYQTMEVVADGLKNSDHMTTEAGMRVVNQITGTLLDTYDELREVVPQEKQGELETMEMPDFIDPAAFDPLVDVRDKL